MDILLKFIVIDESSNCSSLSVKHIIAIIINIITNLRNSMIHLEFSIVN